MFRCSLCDTSAGLRCSFFFTKCLTRLPDGKLFDALRAPFRVDLRAGHAPDLFGVGLEKRAVQPFAEAIDEELLEIFLLPSRGNSTRRRVAKADAGGLAQPQFLDRVRAERDRIIEELAQEINSRFAFAHQHHAFLLDWGRHCPGSCHIARFALVLYARAGSRGIAFLQRQMLKPPVHHPVALGEKAMSANIDSIAAVIHGAGNAAELVAHFNHDGRECPIA